LALWRRSTRILSARRGYGARLSSSVQLGCRPAPAAHATYERALAVVRAQLGEYAFAAAWVAGQAPPFDQAIAEALVASEQRP
jgi:hypothetical protein